MGMGRKANNSADIAEYLARVQSTSMEDDKGSHNVQVEQNRLYRSQVLLSNQPFQRVSQGRREGGCRHISELVLGPLCSLQITDKVATTTDSNRCSSSGSAPNIRDLHRRKVDRHTAHRC